MTRIQGLEALMLHLRAASETKTSRGWSSLDEYPIMFAFSRIYSPDNIIEVGTCNGCSALSYAAGLPRKAGKVYTWDLYSKPAVDEGTNLEARIVRHVDDYANAGAVLSTLKGRKLFFIDGDHSVEGCFKDIQTSLPYFHTGDTMIFHDSDSTKSVSIAIDKAMDELTVLKHLVTRRFHIASKDGFEVLET